MSRWPTLDRKPREPLPERCDRCPTPGMVRVGKHVAVELVEMSGVPHAVDTKPLDLVLCRPHYAINHARLHAEGWRVLDDRR